MIPALPSPYGADSASSGIRTLASSAEIFDSSSNPSSRHELRRRALPPNRARLPVFPLEVPQVEVDFVARGSEGRLLRDLRPELVPLPATGDLSGSA